MTIQRFNPATSYGDHPCPTMEPDDLGDYVLYTDHEAALAAKDEEIARLKRLTGRYENLIYAVHSKFPDESRYETALRYIQERERGSDTPGKESKGCAQHPEHRPAVKPSGAGE